MSKKKIAIIDDEVQILTMLQRYLSKGDRYDVTTFSDSTQGLNSVLNTQYDLSATRYHDA